MEGLCIKGIRELARALGVSTRTAQALTKRPDFPTARIGNLVVVSVAALEEWLANGGTEQRGA